MLVLLVVALNDNPYAETLISTYRIYNLDRGTGLKYLRLDCPWCGENTGKPDTKGHLHFYLDDSVSRCMRCGAWGTARYLFRALGLSLPSETSTSEDYGSLKETLAPRLNALAGASLKRLPSRRALPQAPEIDLPEDSFPIGSLNPRFGPHARILKQLKDWHISLGTAKELGWQWNAGMDAFIFPVYEPSEGRLKLVYWSARSFDGKFRTSAPTDFGFYGILGHLHHPLAKSAREVYIVEGPKDAAALLQENFFAVYLFGHHPNPAQISRLESLSQTKILLLDSDVTEEAKRLSEELGWPAFYLPQGDPGDYAGKLKVILAQLSQKSRSALDSRLNAIRQKLSTTQIRSSTSTSKSINHNPSPSTHVLAQHSSFRHH